MASLEGKCNCNNQVLKGLFALRSQPYVEIWERSFFFSVKNSEALKSPQILSFYPNLSHQPTLSLPLYLSLSLSTLPAEARRGDAAARHPRPRTAGPRAAAPGRRTAARERRQAPVAGRKRGGLCLGQDPCLG